MHTSTYNTQGARGLGWASLAIGLTEIAAPRQVQAMLGLEDRPDHRGVLRILGIREIVHGFHILTEKRPTSAMATGLWARVGASIAPRPRRIWTFARLGPSTARSTTSTIRSRSAIRA